MLWRSSLKRSDSPRELNARANQLARHLQALGVGPETLVGICLKRSTAMVVALMGVMKAGGAYLHSIQSIRWSVLP